ncbi:hypothetical protein ES703_89245 [subsurface metagenome]
MSIYWVEWDDMPGVPVAIADYRIEPLEEAGQKGLTWIEVLIIIAILGILAAVVIPSLLGW